MYFNEAKYKRCISHLIAIKVFIVLCCIALFAFIGAEITALIEDVETFLDVETKTLAIGSVIGAIFGLVIGISATWSIEMKIQEAYWRIDTLNFQKENNLAYKNTPVAKTVVAIENKQSQPEEKKEVEKEEVKS